MSDKIKYIRENSNPEADYLLAIKANAQVCDALYRLSFTADKLSGAQVDNLAYQLEKHTDEIAVLLGRIINVKRTGFRLYLFQDITTKAE